LIPEDNSRTALTAPTGLLQLKSAGAEQARTALGKNAISPPPVILVAAFF
jgi:hypothetical protein